MMTQPANSQDEESSTVRPRLAGAALVLAGVAHLGAPSTLLRLAERSYKTVLRVEFDPLPGAETRVRALGVGLIAVGAHLLYYGGLWPSKE